MNTIKDFVISEYGTLLKYCGNLNEKHIVVPESVSFIKKDAFLNVNMEEVTLPEYTLKIESGAFRNCPFLTTINFPENISVFNPNTFINCPRLKNILIKENDPAFIYKDGLLINTIDNLLCFCSPTLEGEVKIDKNIKGILDGAFSSCSKITSLYISGELDTLEDDAFYGLSSLKKLTLPSTLRRLNQKSFISLTNLESLSFIGNGSNYSCIDNVVYSYYGKNLEFLIPSIKTTTLNIAPTVTCIKNDALTNVNNIKTIIIPKEVNLHNCCEYNDYAFLIYFSNLENIILEDRKVKIHYEWFFNSKYYYKIDEEETKNKFLKYVKNFYPTNLSSELKLLALEKISSIILTDKDVSSEWKDAWLSFIKKQKKQYVYLLPTHPSLLQIYLQYKYFKLSDITYIIDELKENENPEVITQLLNYKNDNFTEEEQTKQLEKEMFFDPLSPSYLRKSFSYRKREDGNIVITSYKGNDTVVTIPKQISGCDVVEIKEYAFSPMNKKIDDKIKANRKNINTVILPDTVTDIGPFAFAGCTSLTHVELTSNMNYYFENIEKPIKRYSGIFTNCPNLKEIIIPEGVTYIGEYFFSDCEGLEKLELPSTLKMIDSNSFISCHNLNKVKIPSSVFLIKPIAFGYRNNLPVIQGEKGSYAQKFARQYSKPFEEI